jgi:hypothetical protein
VRLKHRLTLAALMLAANGCEDATRSIAPVQEQPKVALTISDGSHSSGTPHFFFLPPTVLSPPPGFPLFSGTFDPAVTATARVCQGTGPCAPSAALSSFTGTGGTGGGPLAAIRVNAAFQSYSAVWDTRTCARGPCALDPAKAYRLHVYALNAAQAEVELGFADIAVLVFPAQEQPLPTVDLNNYSPLLKDLPYIIAFRIEKDIAGSVTVSAATPNVAPVSTDLTTATVKDLHGAALIGATVSWSVATAPATGVADPTQPLTPASGQTDNVGTTTTTFKAGSTAGSAVVTATSAPVSASVNITVQSPSRPLYVANSGNNSITIYAAGASGNVAPTATIAGSNTGLNNPVGIALDASGRLYVAQGSAIVVFAAGASGNVAPIATITGSNTGLSNGFFLAIDASGNLYVANHKSRFAGTSSVTIYGAGANGNVAPTATIAGSNTGLVSPYGIASDASGQLYVTNSVSSGILVFAAGASGNVAPSATIAGINTGLLNPTCLEVDASGRLYAADIIYNVVKVFAKGASGDVAPLATIAGSNTGLNVSYCAALDASGQLYVTNYGNNSITIYAVGANGNVAPAATIAGSNTGLVTPVGLAFSR